MYTFDNCVTHLDPCAEAPSLCAVFDQDHHGLVEFDLARDRLTNDPKSVLVHEGVVNRGNTYAAFATFRIGDFEIRLSYSNAKPRRLSAESELRRRAASETKWKLLAMGDTVARVADPESIYETTCQLEQQ
tara:strand:+ start:323 stop:715 length:393 start_codon:yes stop_codon:yes gene_type:complete